MLYVREYRVHRVCLSTTACNMEFKLIYLLMIFTAISAESLDREFWLKNNAKELKAAMMEPNKNIAKNLVLALGDGMSITTTTAIRIYRGQQTKGMLGEEALLSWDKFPYTGLSKTYSSDMMAPDSAASGTAYHCGVKTKFDTLGVDNSVIRNDCSTVSGATVRSVPDFALEEGKSVGIITTDAIVGASPAAGYAHSANRDWQNDAELPDDAKGVCKDIARQLVEDNLDIQVFLGGGREHFYPKSWVDPEDPDTHGERLDGKDLAADWLSKQEAKGRRAKYVIDQAGFDKVTASNTDYLFGMFDSGRMQQETDRRVNKTEPSLAEMTEKAIKILSKNPKGFYLFIEGAAIDKAHHENRARKALEEGLAFDDAVAKVMNMTSTDDTLVVVSADHAHAFTFSGYAQRGQSILSVVNNTVKSTILDKSDRFYTILTYAQGPGYIAEDKRVNVTGDYYKYKKAYPAVVPLKSAAHSGDDVAIFASGPMSHIFTGVHEQTFIAHGMAYAACIGWDKTHCDSVSLAATITPLHSLIIIAVAVGIVL